MNACTEHIYQQLSQILVEAKGKTNAITIDRLALRLHLTKLHPSTGAAVPDRRPVEAALQEHWDRFPFLLVSGSPGVWIPTSADDLNQFIHNIRGRHESLRHKDDITCRKARAFGFTYQDGHFIDPPQAIQQELFA